MATVSILKLWLLPSLSLMWTYPLLHFSTSHSVPGPSNRQNTWSFRAFALAGITPCWLLQCHLNSKLFPKYTVKRMSCPPVQYSLTLVFMVDNHSGNFIYLLPSLSTLKNQFLHSRYLVLYIAVSPVP